MAKGLSPTTIRISGYSGANSSNSEDWPRLAPGKGITLTWSGASSPSGIRGYQIYYSYGAGWVHFLSQANSSSSGSYTFNIPEEISGKHITFTVGTVSSDPSSTVSDLIDDSRNPKIEVYSAPKFSNKTVTATPVSYDTGEFSVNISWYAAAAGYENPVLRYRIYKRIFNINTLSYGEWLQFASISHDSSKSSYSYSWKNVETGQFQFVIMADGQYYSAAQSNNSRDTIVPKIEDCGEVSSSRFVQNPSSGKIGDTVNIQWMYSQNGIRNPKSGYTIQRSINNGSWSNIGTIPKSSALENINSSYSYSYTLPAHVPTYNIKYRIKANSSVGNQYDSEYTESSSYTIQPAALPSFTNINSSYNKENEEFTISWTAQTSTPLDAIRTYNIYYYESSSATSGFTNRILIASGLAAVNQGNSNFGASYTWSGGEFGKYYKFEIVAFGYYSGQKTSSMSSATQKVAQDASAPSKIELSGSAYKKIGDYYYLIPGLSFYILVSGGENATYYKVEMREVLNGVEQNWKEIIPHLNIGTLSHKIKVPSDLEEGDWIEIRAASINASGETSDYYPSNEDLLPQYNIYTFEKENKEYPIVKIKRASSETWNREDKNLNGLRISEGELVYDKTNRILKIGNNGQNSQFSTLPPLFGLFSSGYGNTIFGNNNSAMGRNNTCGELYGAGILDQDGNTLTLTSVENLSGTVTISYQGNYYTNTITALDYENNKITVSGTLPTFTNYMAGFGYAHLTVFNTEKPNMGDISLSGGNNLCVGQNNNNTGSNCLCVGYSNTIHPNTTNLSTMSSGLVAGRNNESNGSVNLIGIGLLGQSGSAGFNELSLVTGRYNSIINGSLFCVGNGSTSSNRSSAFAVTSSKTIIYNQGDFREEIIQGSANSAAGTYSSSFGQGNSSTDLCSVTFGRNTTAWKHQFSLGTGNKTDYGSSDPGDKQGSALIIGNGSSTSKSNAFRVGFNGSVYGSGSYNSSGADYAELYEWEDGNPLKEERFGLFVTLNGDKLKLASNSDDYILGVISARPAVVGDQQDEWHGRYLRDIFGNPLKETVHIEDEWKITKYQAYNEETKELEEIETKELISPAHDTEIWKENPDYDPDREYTPREKRPEWSYVGTHGKLIVIDDGTCSVNGYCWPTKDGIGSNDKIYKVYRVIERLDDKHIKIVIK